jgi:GNAT superfamily N-acetyltransferase
MTEWRAAVGNEAGVRRARPDEARVLSELALRSKAHWGYDRPFLHACGGELTLTPGFIERAEVYAVERGGCVIGFFSLARCYSDVELRHFFVDPPLIGSGLGRMMWEHAIARAARLGYERLIIQSDPNAEGFYRKLGAERIGEVPSGARPGRMLPLLLFRLSERRQTELEP